MSVDTFKYTNHTKEEIEKYLDVLKYNIGINKFIVCTTIKNEKNVKFIEKYKLTKNKQKEMLLQLEVNDFCYSADNNNDKKRKAIYFLQRIWVKQLGDNRKSQCLYKNSKKEKWLYGNSIISYPRKKY